MAVANNMLTTLDLPMWEILLTTPAASAAGVCTCCDPRGTGRYVYILISATSFWRYDTWANSYQQLASPPGGTLGVGTCMCFDVSTGRVWALITNGSAAPTWQYYDPATNTWTSRSVVNLPATFGTEGALVHTDTTVAVTGNDDYFYLIGNAATALYRYSIAGNSWIATLTAAGSTSGAGCGFAWLPSYGAGDRIVRFRGTASATLDYYSIVGNNWTPLTYLPATETFTTGTIVTHGPQDTAQVLYIQRDISGRIYKLDLAALTLGLVATQYLVASGAAHAGQRLNYVKSVDGIEFLYLWLHTSSAYLRTCRIPGV
jgi:hypothetical protein